MVTRPHHFLLIDDDSTSNLIGELTIRKFDKNARVDIYSDPLKALKYIEQQYSVKNGSAPTILILDVNMPAMSGFEFLDEFKKFDSGIREQFIIYMLSSSIEDFNSRSLKYPCVAGFLSKPLMPSYIEEIFEKWVKLESL